MENHVEPVFPTPVIGMLGILPDKKLQMTMDFKQQHDKIYLLGKSRNDISCSEYLYAWHKVKLSPPPYFNIEEEYTFAPNNSQPYKEKAHQLSP